MTSIRETMVEARQEKGLSQSEVARAMGIPQPYLSRMEIGKQITVSVSTLSQWAIALGIDPKLTLD